MTNTNPRLSTKDAAAYLGYSERHLTRLRQQGEGPPYIRLKGRKGRVWYRQSDLDAWLDSKRVIPPRETELMREA